MSSVESTKKDEPMHHQLQGEVAVLAAAMAATKKGDVFVSICNKKEGNKEKKNKESEREYITIEKEEDPLSFCKLDEL
jgi:hypothetical protein